MEQKWTDKVMALKRREPFRLQSVATSLANHLSLPFFMYASRNDPLVPLETYTHSLRKFGNRITYREFETSGHEGYYTEQAIWDDLQKTNRR